MSHYSYSQYLNETFGGKTYKVVISSGLTCPTRDGKIDSRGCAFCDVRGSSSFHGKKGRGLDIHKQLEMRIPKTRERFNAEKILAYFQSYTNTYSDVGYLEEIYEAALSHPDVSGLCIGTRPDCLSLEIIDLLERISQKKYVSLELGIQSLHDPSLEFLKRGHNAQCSIDALAKLSELAPHVQTCGHLMFGAPMDRPDVGRMTALKLNETNIRGVKLHQLMVLDHTELADWFREKPFPVWSLEQYAEVVRDFIEHLSPSIYIERLYATATHPEECLAPKWSTERWKTHNFFRAYFKEMNVEQGIKRFPDNLYASQFHELYQKDF